VDSRTTRRKAFSVGPCAPGWRSPAVGHGALPVASFQLSRSTGSDGPGDLTGFADVPNNCRRCRSQLRSTPQSIRNIMLTGALTDLRWRPHVPIRYQIAVYSQYFAAFQCRHRSVTSFRMTKVKRIPRGDFQSGHRRIPGRRTPHGASARERGPIPEGGVWRIRPAESVSGTSGVLQPGWILVRGNPKDVDMCANGSIVF
jgi:hypothetical protein